MNEKSMGMPAPAEHVAGEEKKTITLDQMKMFADHPYVRSGDEKFKDDRSWPTPEEPLEEFSAEHYKRVEELMEYQRGQVEIVIQQKAENVRRIWEAIEKNIKSVNMRDFLLEINSLYLDFWMAEANIQEGARQAHERHMQWQGSSKEYAKQESEVAYQEGLRAFIQSKYKDEDLNLDMFPDASFILSGLCDLGEKRYPEYDWHKIREAIYFGDLVADKLDDYLLSVAGEKSR